MMHGEDGIEIRADFWQPHKNERKVELIKYWHQCTVLERMKIQISKKLPGFMRKLYIYVKQQ